MGGVLRTLGAIAILGVLVAGCDDGGGGGRGWTEAQGLEGFSWFGAARNALARDPADPNRLLLATPYGGLLESHDRGASWVRIARDLELDAAKVSPPTCLAVGPGGRVLVGTAGAGIRLR